MNQRKTWKIERWSNTSKGASAYRRLGFREMFIVACADVDAALAEAISRRLLGPEGEIIAFLGADESALAPAGTLSARIQLALLLGIISGPEAEFLRSLKKIRNIMSHRVNVRFKDQRVQNALSFVVDASIALPFAQNPDDPKKNPYARTGLREHVLSSQSRLKTWIVLVLLHMQFGFYNIIDTIERIPASKHEGLFAAAESLRKQLS